MAMLLDGVPQRLLPHAATQLGIVPWSVILHTVVGNPTLDMPLDVRADSNLRPNSFIATVNGTPKLRGAVSVETGDNYYAGDPDWTGGWSSAVAPRTWTS